MQTFPPAKEMLEAFGYPACWVAGLLAGLVSRRWVIAGAIGFVTAVVLDAAGTYAFSDAPPHLHLGDSVLYGLVGALIAVAVFGLKKSWQRRGRS